MRELHGSTSLSADRLLSVLEHKHLLLVALLLTNSFAMEALPVFLDRVVPAWAAVVISMTAILILGEILPQAVCTGPNQLSIAVYALPLVNLLIVATFPVAYPIARVLDFIFGGHSDHLTSHRQKLKALVHLNRVRTPGLSHTARLCLHDIRRGNGSRRGLRYRWGD